MAAPQTIHIDGQPFLVEFQSHYHPLKVLRPGGDGPVFPPYSLRSHLALIRQELAQQGNLVGLPSSAFLKALCPGQPLDTAWEPLALWWAGGGEAKPPALTEGGWLAVRGGRLRLAPWSGLSRLEALAACLPPEEGAGLRFDLGGYLERMVRACVAQRTPETLDPLDVCGPDLHGLLESLLRINLAGQTVEKLLQGFSGLALRQAAWRLWSICRLMGWPLERLQETPARELDALAQLASLASPPGWDSPSPGARPAKPRGAGLQPGPPGLGQAPDAIVIQIEEEPS